MVRDGADHSEAKRSSWVAGWRYPHPRNLQIDRVSEGTYHRCGGLYGGLKPKALKRLRVLEKENARLKKIVADQAMDLSLLREVAQGKY